MEQLPLVRRSTFIHCTRTLELRGCNATRMLARHGIRSWHCGSPDDWIPFADLLEVLDAGSKACGTPNFGIAVSSEFPMDFGTFGRVLMKSASLYGACKRVVRLARHLNTSTRFWVSETPDSIWLCRAKAPSWQMEQYVLGHMIALVKMASGNSWFPSDVYVTASRAPGFEQLDNLAGARISFDRPCTAIAIEKKYLMEPLMPGPGFGGEASERNLVAASPYGDPIRLLESVVESVLRERYCDIETVSEIFGTSTRQLQRDLAKEGLKFRDLIGRVRYRMACELLADGDLTEEEIAHALCYSHTSHFIRAFRRWSGLTPGEHRSLHEKQTTH